LYIASVTGSYREYMKNVSFLWPPVVAAHDWGLNEHYKVAEVIGSRKTIFIPWINFMSIIFSHSPQTVQKMISDQIAFVMTIDMA
jgi:hypothetical protein